MSIFKKLFHKTNQSQPTLISNAPSTSEEEATHTSTTAADNEFITLRDDGIRAMHMGEFPYAERCFQAALERKSDDSTERLLAEVHLRANEGGKALPVLQHLVEAHPDEIQLYLAQAQAAQQAQQWQTMAQAAQQIIRLDTNNPNGPYFSAFAANEQGNPIVAVALLTPIIEQHPNTLLPRMLRARILFKMAQYSEAINDTTLILQADPNNEEAAELMGDIHHAMNNNDKAIEAYNQLRSINPFNQQAWLKTGEIYINQNHLDKALALFDEAIELDPQFAAAYKARGGVRLKLHDAQGATDDLKKSLELAPEQAQQIDGEFNNIENAMNARFKSLNPYGF